MDKLKNLIVTDIIDIKTIPSAKGRFETITNRKCYALSFCMSGKITYSHNGRKFISEQNTAIILPKGQTYTLYGNEKGLFPVINFDCKEHLSDTFITIPVSDNEFYIKNYEQMLSLSMFEGNNARIMSILYSMIHSLSLNAKVNSAILPALDSIEKSYSDSNLNNRTLAEKCNISEIYLRKLFLKQFDTTPKQFLLDVRLRKARQLLTEGTLKVNVISDKCGFSNPYHFCRIFKEKTGITPTEYMKQNKEFKI